jgi:hypothetical protein
VPELKVPDYDVSSEARGEGEVLGAVYGRTIALHVSSSTLWFLYTYTSNSYPPFTKYIQLHHTT